jgi:ketosteroid isomerase-like protein
MKKLITRALILLFTSLIILSCRDSTKSKLPISSTGKAELENEVWQMEESYWEYVQNIDTVTYKTLWHDDFIGYPSFGDGVSNKSKIAIWIPELHQDTSLTFSYKLYKKAVNAIEDVVIVFYDTDEMWTDKAGKAVRKETYKFTHTWKKQNDNWVILGGMAGNKN